MRPMIKLTTSTLFALAAASVAPAAPAAAADYYLTFGPVKSTSASGKVREAAARADAGKQIEVMSWSWGASQKGWDGSVKGSTAAASVSSGAPVAGDVNGDGRASARVPAGDYDGDSRADAVQAPRDSASGMATGKRQHGFMPPLRPREPGSVTVVGKFPACVVGAAYDDATLRAPGMSYTLHKVVVTGCPATPGATGGEPTQSISLNFTKISLAK